MLFRSKDAAAINSSRCLNYSDLLPVVPGDRGGYGSQIALNFAPLNYNHNFVELDFFYYSVYYVSRCDKCCTLFVLALWCLDVFFLGNYACQVERVIGGSIA